MASVMAAVAADGISVVLSSHVLAELERVADYLIVLSHGQVQVAGEVADLLAEHRVLTGPRGGSRRCGRAMPWCMPRPRRRAVAPAGQDQRRRGRPVPAGWQCRRVGLEETRPRLPARARRRGAAAASASHGNGARS